MTNPVVNNTTSSLSKTGLPYQFKLLCKNKLSGDKVFDHVYIFQTKHNLKYQVNLIQYHIGVFGVKFHLKLHSKNPNKYKLLSNKGDSITVLKTIVAIMKHALDKHDGASFAFMGMPLQSEGINNTKRYTVYKLYCRRYFNPKTFDHVYDPNRSFYMLLNKNSTKKIDQIDIVNIAERELRVDTLEETRSEVNLSRSTA